MRGTPFGPRRSVTTLLLLVNVAVFFLQFLVARVTPFDEADSNYFFGLSIEGLRHGYVWQLLTYQFMHAGLIHLFFNCWAIYVFGQDVEEALGRRSYLALYFCSGVLGGLVQILAGLTLGGFFARPVVGASAAAFGLASAFAVLFPDRVLLLFFVLPVRAKWLLLLSAGLALLGVMKPGDGIAHAAHLGGMITGVLFVRYAAQWNWRLPTLGRSGRQTPRKLVKVVSGGGLWNRGKTVSEADIPPEEFLSKEVDPILDKISAHGIQSLTDRERRILEAARQKMSKR